MADDFEFSLRIDDRGVVLKTYGGTFDLEKWAAQARLLNPRVLGDPPDLSRPVVTDLRRFRPPAGDWMKSADELFRHLDDLGETQARAALVTGGNKEAELASRFYIAYKAAVRGTGGEVRAFADYDEGYAWATEGWAGTAAAKLAD